MVKMEFIKSLQLNKVLIDSIALIQT